MARIVFLGTPDFGATVLARLLDADHEIVAVVTQPDRPSGRGRHVLQASPVKLLAQLHGLTLLQPARLGRDHSAVRALGLLAPDVLVLAAYGQLLRREMLDLAPGGCIGVHASLLPRHRGAAPVPATILAGDLETGVSLMLTDAGMDTGAVIAQRSVTVRPSDTTASLTRTLAGIGASLLVDTLAAWLSGSVVPQPQDAASATYAPEISRDQGGIDWFGSAGEIDRLVRAMHPWPGAFCGCGPATLKVISAHPLSDWTGAGDPGAVVRLGREVGIVTGRGLLVLDQVQLQGRRAMSACDFARGRGDLSRLVLGWAAPRT